jgi:ABC-2 type transport system permease protein
VTTAGVASVLEDTELGNPVNLKRGTFDVSFVVIFLLPIFIIAITYDMLTRESERGTLAMVLSHPIQVRALIANKVLARFFIVLSVVIAFGVGSLLAVGDQLQAADTWARFALWLVATLFYALFWFGLAAIVNARGRRSSTNGVILAGSWLLLVIVLPTLVSILATTAYPAPSRFDFITASRSAQTVSERQYMQALNEYYYEHVEYAPESKVGDFLAVTKAKNEAVEKAVRPLYERFRSQRALQEGLVGSFQFISPAIMMQRLLNDVSGTSATRHAHFVEQVESFRNTWVSYFTVRFLLEKPLSSAEFAEFPRFQYVEEDFRDVLGRLAPSLAGLLLVALLAGFVAIALLRRYRVVDGG